MARRPETPLEAAERLRAQAAVQSEQATHHLAKLRGRASSKFLNTFFKIRPTDINKADHAAIDAAEKLAEHTKNLADIRIEHAMLHGAGPAREIADARLLLAAGDISHRNGVGAEKGGFFRRFFNGAKAAPGKGYNAVMDGSAADWAAGVKDGMVERKEHVGDFVRAVGEIGEEAGLGVAVQKTGSAIKGARRAAGWTFKTGGKIALGLGALAVAPVMISSLIGGERARRKKAGTRALDSAAMSNDGQANTGVLDFSSSSPNDALIGKQDNSVINTAGMGGDGAAFNAKGDPVDLPGTSSPTETLMGMKPVAGEHANSYLASKGGLGVNLNPAAQPTQSILPEESVGKLGAVSAGLSL